MADENVAGSSLKRSRDSPCSPQTETQEETGNESQISTFSIDEEISCGICLGVLEFPYTVIPCLHTFDKDCLLGWWQRNNTCPLCKTKATSARHSFQFQSIVNHYDAKRPRKRARSVGDNDGEVDKADIYPFGVAPPPAPVNQHEDEDEDEWNDDEEDDEEDGDDLFVGGRLIFPCPACRQGHPSGYTCPTPIPEPTDAMKDSEAQEYLNRRRAVAEPERGQRRISLAEGLHNIPEARHLFTDEFKTELNRACDEHVMCICCSTYMPRNRPHRAESTCKICSKATCALFDPLGCPLDFGQFTLLSFNETGTRSVVDSLWRTLTRLQNHFQRNMAEFVRFTNHLATYNLTVPVIVQEILRSAGHNAEDYFCQECVNNTLEREFAAWWQAKRDSGTVPVPAEVANLPNCWYGKECRTQGHNVAHADRYNHDCDPRPPAAAPVPAPAPPQP